MNVPFTQVVVEALRRRGTASAAEILADVGSLVSAARAVSVGRSHYRTHKDKRHRRPSTATLERAGRREIVSECLRVLARSGQIERVAPGVYRWAVTLPLRPPRIA